MSEDEAYKLIWDIIDPLRDSGGFVDFEDFGPGDELVRKIAKAVAS